MTPSAPWFRLRLGSLLLASLLAAGAAQAPRPGTNADAQLIADFTKRVEKYMALHKAAQKHAPELKETNDPGRIQAAQAALAARIKDARKGAKPGEILTPDIQQLFRRLLNPEMKGVEGQQTKETLKEDAPAGVRLAVNASYPENAPLPTVPPNLLAALPRLPEDLEYRILDKDLILRDVPANLIVDYMPKAIR